MAASRHSDAREEKEARVSERLTLVSGNLAGIRSRKVYGKGPDMEGVPL